MNQRGFTVVEVLFVVVAMAAVGGWIANIVKLAGMCCEASGWLILRGVGVAVVPLGVVLGFL